MTFAHNGIELKPIPFVEPEAPAEPKAPEVASDADAAPDALGDLGASQPRPSNLSAATTERLLAIDDLMQKAPVSSRWPRSSRRRRSGCRRARLSPLAAGAAPVVSR